MKKFFSLFFKVFNLLPRKYKAYYIAYTVFTTAVYSASMALPLLYAGIIDKAHANVFDTGCIILYALLTLAVICSFKVWSFITIRIRGKIKLILSDHLYTEMQQNLDADNSSVISINLECLADIFSDYVYTLPSQVFSLIAVLVILLNTSWVIFAVQFVCLLGFVFFTERKNRKILQWMESAQEKYSEINNEMLGFLSGATDIYVYRAQNWLNKKREQFSKDYSSKRSGQYECTLKYNLFINFMVKAMYIASIVISLSMLINGSITLGICAIINTYMLNIYEIIGGYADNISYLLSFVPHMSAILDYLSIKKQKKSSNYQYTESIPVGTVRVKNLGVTLDSFSISGFELSARSGETVAITGESGAGKTTAIKAISDFVAAEHGTIEINPESRIITVEQSPFIYNRTLHENVFLDDSVHTADIPDKLLEVFNLKTDDFTDDSNEQRKLGEDGSEISGGQRAKISLIRALLAAPDILILDEPLTGVDHDTRIKVMQYIRDQLSDKLIILTSHDNDILQFADRSVDISQYSRRGEQK